MKVMTQEELETKIKTLGELPEDTIKGIVCQLIGHSRIKHYFWGYYTCARCNAQIGDSLGGCYDGAKDVIVGHKCETCIENYKGCTWEDKYMVEDPFAEPELNEAL